MLKKKSKVLFIGAGAVCSYLGAFLTKVGHDVTLVDAWADQIEAVRAHGIYVTGPHDPFEARPKAVHLTESAKLGADYDMAFVGLKAYDTAWATQLALRHLSSDGFVISAQNCWVDPIMASVAGAARCVGLIMSRIFMTLMKPGHVDRGIDKGQGRGQYIVFRPGEHDGKISRRVTDLAALLTPTSEPRLNWRSSMAQDAIKGRRTEIDFMNGHIVERGDEVGVATPVSAAVVSVVREIDADLRKPSAENMALALRRAGM